MSEPVGQTEVKPAGAVDSLQFVSAQSCVSPGWSVVDHSGWGSFQSRIGCTNHEVFPPAKSDCLCSRNLLFAVEAKLLVPSSADTKHLWGHYLRRELLGRDGLANAIAWKFFEKHPELFPKDTHGKKVAFFGTVCRDPRGVLCVPIVEVKNGKCHAQYWWLDLNWSDMYIAFIGDSKFIATM